MKLFQYLKAVIFILFLNGCSSGNDDMDISSIDNFEEEQVIVEQTTSVSEINLGSNSTGSFNFVPEGSLSNKIIEVFYHIPDGEINNIPILFSFHGGSRNAIDYRDAWINMANENGFMVFAPKFDNFYFEGGDMYNLANIFQDGDNPSSSTFNSSDLWTFSLIDKLFDFIVNEINGIQTEYNAWGHSGGAQFLHRFTLYLPDSKVNKVICSNAGWYTVPENGIPFPYGLDQSELTDNKLISAFSKKLYLHLGDEDTDPSSSSLRHNEVLDDQQGLNRLVRGRYFYENSKTKAESLNVDFNWIKTPEVEGVGHNAQLMANDALQYILEN